MQFWSKGLGEKTIDLYLSKGETIKSGDTLYLKGQMEAPVSWEYIMPLSGEDLVDFLALLQDPAVAEYVYRSPDRWRLYTSMLLGGLQLAGLVLAHVVRRMLGRVEPEPEVTIQVPPPTERKSKGGRSLRRRLGTKRTSAPSATRVREDEAKALSAGG